MEKDMGQFLRRLPIIIVEDVCLISQFSIIVWLMAAFPNFKIYNNHKRWLLGFIVKLTQYSHKEIIEKYQLLHQEEEQILYESIANFCPENVIVSNGLSKWCGAGGWRLGYFIIPNKLNNLKNSMKVLASETFSAVSAPIQFAAVSAFKDDHRDYLMKSKKR